MYVLGTERERERGSSFEPDCSVWGLIRERGWRFSTQLLSLVSYNIILGLIYAMYAYLALIVFKTTSSRAEKLRCFEVDSP